MLASRAVQYRNRLLPLEQRSIKPACNAMTTPPQQRRCQEGANPAGKMLEPEPVPQVQTKAKATFKRT